ncbi:MAG: hypothetical protein RMM98_16010 [Acidobacteriota bacterium]|nr:hypothetical protein [Blastocatellia bacterium]MDW8241108.1 hypothetical protein [Acidobacteriota bacterium]
MARITERSAREAGAEDARRNYPPSDFDGQDGRISDFEKQVATVTKKEIADAVEKWRQRENEVLKELRTMVPELQASLHRFEDTLETHRRQFSRDVAPEPPHRYGKVAIAVLVLLFLFEGGVNIFTFRFLREPGITTVVIGLALAVLIPFSGFYAGRILKAKEKGFVEWVVAVLLVLSAAALIFVVAQGRRIGIEARKHDPKIVEEAFLIFLLLNILLFGIAFGDGYFSGYVYPRLQKAYEELRRRKRQYMNRRARLNEAFIGALSHVREKLATAQQLGVVYREANRRARGNVPQEEIPKYFVDASFKVTSEVPQEIRKYLDSDEPVRDYEKNLTDNEEAIKNGQELIGKIDRAFKEAKS